MKKRIFTAHLLPLAVLFGFVLAFASCANEDAVQKPADTNADNDKSLTTFTGGTEPSRTSMDYTTGAFFWEAGDHIWVKDDDGVWQKSSNAPTAKTAYFKFYVPGKFSAHTSYKVYYPGKNGSNNQVVIPATQTQTTPATTGHIGASGDCATGDANKVTDKDQFQFTLDHQATILVFLPYTSNTVLKDCYLTKVEVTSDNDITDTYTLDPTSGEITGTGTGKQINLITQGSGAYANGFPLNTTSASVATNGAYMVIKPGTHILRVRYWLKDIATNIEGTITKTLSSFNYAKNTYYDMNSALDIKDYDGDHFYMWDAKKQYWDGYEWTKNLPLGIGQPTLRGQPAGNYPKNSTDPRYFRDRGTVWGRFDATQSCADLPNANEMAWYVEKGDPCWGDELWTTMGHLHKGGIWLKKRSHISGFNANKAPDGFDWRTSRREVSRSASNMLPSVADASNYFYLPALDDYLVGKLDVVGYYYYWSSSADPSYLEEAYCLYFTEYHSILVQHMGFGAGLRAQPFSDFGDE